MISVSIASSPADFEAVSILCRALTDFDAAIHAANGIAPELVVELFHAKPGRSLAEIYSGQTAAMFLARWDGQPAGCLAFSAFDAATDEIEKFYVDPEFRRKGIGRALMQAVLAQIEARRKTRVLLQTSLYLADAVLLYRSFGFAPCALIQPVPDALSQTEICMSRAL